MKKKMQSKEVIDALQRRDLDDLKKVVEDGFKGIHDRQDKTNGNVMNLQLWRAYITGAIAILAAVILPIVFLAIKQLMSGYF